jgi:hypothetical protein
MLAVLVALAAVRPAGAQEARLARLGAATREAVQAVLDSAQALGLPAEPLVDRALEGAAKAAPGHAIVAAVRRLARDLALARSSLGGTATAAELDAAAAALRAGVSADVLARLRRERASRPLAVPLAVLADLVASGVPVEDATVAVLALAPGDDAGLVEFRRSVERDIALGAPPAAAAAVRLNATARDGLPGARRP